MACSKYEYVKKFEENRSALLQSYIVVRIDVFCIYNLNYQGRSFTKFCQKHDFDKPNDIRAIKLMNKAANYVMDNFKDIFLAYGESDEYSFALLRDTNLFSRRTDKILSCIVSAFSSAYVFFWKDFFKEPLQEIPVFDSRVVLYPNEKCLKDYFRWRQVDCHINNLYNTLFWSMVKSGMSNKQVEKYLKDTNSAQKNQKLFSDYGINYAKLDDIYRRGTFICYKMIPPDQSTIEELKVKDVGVDDTKKEEKASSSQQAENAKQKCEDKQSKTAKITKEKIEQYKLKNALKPRKTLCQVHEDCIKQTFWDQIVQK